VFALEKSVRDMEYSLSIQKKEEERRRELDVQDFRRQNERLLEEKRQVERELEFERQKMNGDKREVQKYL
jgi:hypothetical protein